MRVWPFKRQAAPLLAYVYACVCVWLRFLHELMSCSRALRQAEGMREATGAGPGQRPSNISTDS